MVGGGIYTALDRADLSLQNDTAWLRNNKPCMNGRLKTRRSGIGSSTNSTRAWILRATMPPRSWPLPIVNRATTERMFESSGREEDLGGAFLSSSLSVNWFLSGIQSVQTRLLDENKVLSPERSRIADLVANVQRMHNDIDKAKESDRRRFETEIHTLEAQA